MKGFIADLGFLYKHHVILPQLSLILSNLTNPPQKRNAYTVIDQAECSGAEGYKRFKIHVAL